MDSASWEARMAAQAAARRAAAREREWSECDAERERQEAAHAAEEEQRRLAGPPCRACYQFQPSIWSGWKKDWVHVGTDTIGETAVCRCLCHPEPVTWPAVIIG